LGVRLTSSCKKKFVENLLRKKNLDEAKADYRAAAPLMMMIMVTLPGPVGEADVKLCAF
jgi:hypothetical protein